MDQPAIGRQLRARRTAAGRTVASVAAAAGLSVPYIANLENGRGNPTITALTRLADALGMQLAVTLEAGDESQSAWASASPEIPASLVTYPNGICASRTHWAEKGHDGVPGRVRAGGD